MGRERLGGSRSHGARGRRGAPGRPRDRRGDAAFMGLLTQEGAVRGTRIRGRNRSDGGRGRVARIASRGDCDREYSDRATSAVKANRAARAPRSSKPAIPAGSWRSLAAQRRREGILGPGGRTREFLEHPPYVVEPGSLGWRCAAFDPLRARFASTGSRDFGRDILSLGGRTRGSSNIPPYNRPVDVLRVKVDSRFLSCPVSPKRRGPSIPPTSLSGLRVHSR
jgi:hypothetical protein